MSISLPPSGIAVPPNIRVPVVAQDILKFTRRAPRQRSESPSNAALAYVEIPKPDPELAVSIIDVAAGTPENAHQRAVEILYEGQVETVTVRRDKDPTQAFTITGGYVSPIRALSGLRWDMQCTSPSSNGVTCSCIDPPVISIPIPGTAGDSYEVTVRFRGIVETRAYPGSFYNDGSLWSAGIDPENPADSYNIYRLDISDPPQVFYLNTVQGNYSSNSMVIDYTKTIKVNANAVIKMTARGMDGGELITRGRSVPGVDPAINEGQFIQMDVVSVTSSTNIVILNDTPIHQEVVVCPIQAVRVEESAAGSWTPVVSRGIFYRVWRMNASEGASSWLRLAGFQDGQYLLLAYTTELDWKNQCGSNQWTGTGTTGGGGTWETQRPVSLASSTRTLLLTPSGIPSSISSPRLLAVGGLKTSTGLELLAEASQFIGGQIQPPGRQNPLNQVGHVWVECFPATGQTLSDGRTRADRPLGQELVADWSTQTYSASRLLTDLSVTVDPSAVVFRFSGAFYVETEGFYTVTTLHGGKLRLFHWGLPVVDQWYGQPRVASRTDLYSSYLHVGWHDYIVEWAPDLGTDTINLTHTGNIWWSSGPTTNSQVQAIDTEKATVTLKQGYVSGGDSGYSPTLICAYAAESSGLSVKGYVNDSHGYVGLDLNPAYGRFCSRDTGTSSPTEIRTQDWALHSSCWLYAIPSMACALTNVSGAPITNGYRDWLSCVSHGVKGTIRWGRVSNQDTLQPGISGQSPLAASSSFGGAILGQSVYSSSVSSTGILPEYDPRTLYDSGVVFAHLNVVGGTPSLDSVKIYDVRSRGGGLSHETSPSLLPTGGPKERTETNWDLSPWDGYDGPVTGTALYEVPQSVLTGEEGNPIFTAEEVEAMIWSTVPAGIKPIIIYTP